MSATSSPATTAGSEIVGALNQVFGTRYDAADGLFFSAIIAAALEDPDIRKLVQGGDDAETLERVRERLSTLISQVIQRQQQIFQTLLRGGDFARVVREQIFRGVHEALRTK